MRFFRGIQSLTVVVLMTACNPAPPVPQASDLVSRAVTRTTALTSMHFVLDVTHGFVLLGPSLQVTRAEGEVARPDQLRVRATARFGGVVVETDMIHIDDESFLLNPFSARWEQVAGSLTPVPLLDPERGIAKVMRSVSNPRVDGQQTLDGARAWRIKGTVAPVQLTALLGGTPLDGTIDAEAVVDDEGLVRLLTLRGPVVAGELAETTRRIELSQFDSATPIARPGLP